ncbi:MAG: signal peptidase I [Candidatus Woesearchaeota archaeon]
MQTKKSQKKSSSKYKQWIKKAWNFIWHSDSVWSWLLNIALAFLFIKFIFYPGIGLLLNTSYPVVAVVLGSMEHMQSARDGKTIPEECGNTYENTKYFVSLDYYWQECGEWYEKNNITKEQFSKFPFRNGFNKGDIIVIYGENPKNLKIGDVIVFYSDQRPEPIIHRIVEINKDNSNYIFNTKGDHNKIADPRIDINIHQDKIIGKGVFRIPLLGWIKIWFMNIGEFIIGVIN